MEQSSSTQPHFLEQFVRAVLAKHGLDNLTPEQESQYIPEFVSQLERRMGYHMLPKLSEEKVVEFNHMLEADEQADASTWQSFWYESVPNFETELQAVLEGFDHDVKELLA